MRLTKLVAIAAAAAALAVPVTAQPSEAATGVSFCFVWEGNTAYRSMPVHLVSWTGSRWEPYRNGQTNSNGCGLFSNTRTDRHLKVTADTYRQVGSQYWMYRGETPLATPGSGTVNVGTGVVKRYM